jgi:uncharacterized protein (DUF2147 family)
MIFSENQCPPRVRISNPASAAGLNLKGCALGFICKGETWQRVK